MTKWIDRRADGSIAFFIDGDLQFDSKDERIYHEALALPALALSMRNPETGKALIIGGGDGLTARELLKSSQIQHIDLVDYDPEVLALARTAFAGVNHESMSDPRLLSHATDAWLFVQESISAGTTYDVIIVDLTVAQDLDGAKFHSTEWYEMLNHLMHDSSVLATNGVSPCVTPEAFFCIFNGIRKAGLYAVPYRIAVPSFTDLGYGPDWGFLLAARDCSIIERLKGDLDLAQERHALQDSAHLRKLFTFPNEVYEYQSESSPAGKNSEIFLHYLYNADDVTVFSGGVWNALDADLSRLPLPDTDIGGYILPMPLRALLSQAEEQQELLLARVLRMMPALNRFQTRQMVADFISDPGAFLESIDLVALVEELLRRAAELPGRIVAELKLLQARLVDWAGDNLSLMQMGSRITTIVAVVVILGNLLYPDAVYGKGEHNGGGHAGDHGAHAGGNRGHVADRGDRGDEGRRAAADRNWGNRGLAARDNWGHWNDWGGRWGNRGGWARPWHRWWGGGWGGWTGWAPWAGWGIPAAAGISVINALDEQGNQYPPRTYNYNPTYVTEYGAGEAVEKPDDSTVADAGSNASAATAAAPAKGLYRLGPDTDILPDSRVAMQLTSGAYLMVVPGRTDVIDQATAKPLISLYSDPSLRWHLSSELQRQQKRIESSIQSKRGGMDSSGDLGFQQTSDQSQSELTQMQTTDTLIGNAIQKFGTVGQDPPPPEKAPIDGAIEVFTSVWMTPDGGWLLVKRADGSLAYMNGQGWYSDQGKTKLTAPYPAKFKAVVAAYLTNLTKEASSVTASISQDKQEAQQRIQDLNQNLQTLLPQENAAASAIPSAVQFGADTVQQPEALRRTKMSIRRAQHRLDFLNKELQSIPVESTAATKMLVTLNT